jgi:hypothetical protein
MCFLHAEGAGSWTEAASVCSQALLTSHCRIHHHRAGPNQHKKSELRCAAPFATPFAPTILLCIMCTSPVPEAACPPPCSLLNGCPSCGQPCRPSPPHNGGPLSNEVDAWGLTRTLGQQQGAWRVHRDLDRQRWRKAQTEPSMLQSGNNVGINNTR